MMPCWRRRIRDALAQDKQSAHICTKLISVVCLLSVRLALAHELEGFFYHVSDELQRSTTFTQNG